MPKMDENSHEKRLSVCKSQIVCEMSIEISFGICSKRKVCFNLDSSLDNVKKKQQIIIISAWKME